MLPYGIYDVTSHRCLFVNVSSEKYLMPCVRLTNIVNSCQNLYYTYQDIYLYSLNVPSIFNACKVCFTFDAVCVCVCFLCDSHLEESRDASEVALRTLTAPADEKQAEPPRFKVVIEIFHHLHQH